MAELNLQPNGIQPNQPVQSNQPNPPSQSIFNGNKGLLIAIVLGIIAVIIGISALLNSGSGNKYEGLIRKVENENQQLKTF